jgi:hypothetical protein
MWHHVVIDSKNGNRYYASLSANGKNMTGWRNCNDYEPVFVYYDDTMVIMNFTAETTTIYDYTGKKLSTLDGLHFGTDGEGVKIPD